MNHLFIYLFASLLQRAEATPPDPPFSFLSINNESRVVQVAHSCLHRERSNHNEAGPVVKPVTLLMRTRHQEPTAAF